MKNYRIYIYIILALSIVLNVLMGKYLRGYNDLKINFADQSIQLDSAIYKNEVSEVNLRIWKMMNDSNSLVIKHLQDSLKIKDKDLKNAGRIIAELRAKELPVTTYIKADTIIQDSIIYVHVDSLDFKYRDEWTAIDVYGDLDSLKLDYSVDADLSVIQHTAYKPAKTKFGRWWYRLWKVGKHEEVTIQSDNPNMKIDEIKWVKLKD